MLDEFKEILNKFCVGFESQYDENGNETIIIETGQLSKIEFNNDEWVSFSKRSDGILEHRGFLKSGESAKWMVKEKV